MKVKKVLVEGKLSKTEVDDLTKRWFEVKNDDSMSDVKKRTAYDEIYDEATDKVFDIIKTVKGYVGVKEYMRTQWLKVGFEAGDGNNKAVNLCLDLLNKSSIAPAQNIVPFILENYNYIDDFLDSGDDFQEDFRNFLMTRTDLWTRYSKEDIIDIIGSMHAQLKESKDKKATLAEFAKLNNLRDVLRGNTSKKNSNTIKVQKIDNSSKEQDIIDNLKRSGFDFSNEENLNKLDKITQEARKNL